MTLSKRLYTAGVRFVPPSIPSIAVMDVPVSDKVLLPVEPVADAVIAKEAWWAAEESTLTVSPVTVSILLSNAVQI